MIAKMAKTTNTSWISRIIFILPTLTCICYVIFSIVNVTLKLNINNLYESKNYCEMLKSTISFVSIINSFLGLLISTLISNKEKDGALKLFLSQIDTTEFSRCIKQTILSGLITILISCILLMNDLYLIITLIFINTLWIWFFLFYLLSTYRFISLLLDLFLGTENRKKDTVNKISQEDEEILKARLRDK